MSIPASDDDSLLSYSIRFSERASRDLDAAFIFTVETAGEEIGRVWRRGLLDALGTLATLPTRCVVAPEADKLKPPVVRQLVYRRNPSATAWRVLFRVYEADDGDSPHVGIAAILHGSRRPLTRKEARQIDSSDEVR